MQNSDCKDCKLHASCTNVCLTTAQKTGELMVIVDMPAESDDKHGSIMASQKDSMIFKIITDAIHGDIDRVYKSYAIKCRPPEGTKPGNKEIAACKKYLLEEIEEIKPRAILLVGDLPMKMLLGLSGITKERGKVHQLTTEHGDIPCVPVFAPGYVQHAYTQFLIKQYAEDIYKAWNLSLGVDDAKKKSDVVNIETMDEFYEMIGYILQTKIVSFDYETSAVDDEGLGVFDPEFKVTLISAAFQHGGAYTIPMQHAESPFDEQDLKEIWQVWNEDILENPEIHKIAHNAKYELLVSRRFGCKKIRGRLDDTMLMHHLLFEADRHGLKGIVDQYYPDFQGYEDEVKTSAAKVGWEKIPMKLLSPYGGTDADLTFRLRDLFETMLLKDERSYTIYRNLTMYAIRALFAAEWRGMLIDKEVMLKNIARAEDLLAQQEIKLREYKQVTRFEDACRKMANEEKQKELEEKLAKAEPLKDGSKGKQQLKNETLLKELKAGLISYYNDDDRINFGSPAQLGDLIYEPHGFAYNKVWDRKKKAETKSTDKKILNQMNDKWGFFEDLKLWRSISKNLSTYLMGIYNRLDVNSRVHTSFLLHGTETGRLSSRNPNLQNLPSIAKLQNEIAIEMVSMVKKAFIPPKGKYIVQFDYAQAELRIIAEFADETNMLQAYADGQDLHAITGAKFKNMTLEEFKALPKDEFKKARFEAKAGNFGMIYLISPEGFVDYALNSYNVKINLDTSKEWMAAFFELYPKLREYHETYIAKAEKFGFVRTLFGRKRHTPEINNPDEYIAAFDQRVAVNSPVQGTAGEFTIFAAALCADRLGEEAETEFVNTIHDSMIFYVPEERMKYDSELIVHTMENLPCKQYFGRELEKIGMKADTEYSAKCWKDMQPYEN